MSKPSSAASRTSSVFTTAFVASGTNAGVRTSPCASFSVPVRARDRSSRVRMSKQDTGARTLAAPPRCRGGRQASIVCRSVPEISILRGLRSSGFGMRTSSTPRSKLALTPSGSTPLGSASDREKAPNARSTR